MGEVVATSEFGIPRIHAASGTDSAKTALVSQMYTDAVFNQDIRVIQTIINRVDGGLPKDTEVDEFQTLFGDCMTEVLAITDGTQLQVTPDDSVMMALCKSLLSISLEDIYHKIDDDGKGHQRARKVNPSVERRQARDSARRLVLERAGGRKTAVPKPPEQRDNVVVAPWIKGAIAPGAEDADPLLTETPTDG